MTKLLFHIPNLLTLMRAILGILGASLLLASTHAANETQALNQASWSFALLLICAISDGLDGWIARYLNAQTQLGAFLDPVADKILANAYLIAYTIISAYDIYLVIPVSLIIARDILLTIFRQRTSNSSALSVSFDAKIKTGLLFALLLAPFGLYLIGLRDISLWYHYWLGGIWFIALLSLWTTRQYIQNLINKTKDNDNNLS